MEKKNFMRRVVSLVFVVTIIFYGISNNYDNAIGYVKTEEKQQYVIVTNSQSVMQDISEEYDVEIIKQKGKRAKQSYAVSLMTQSDADNLEAEQEVLAVEKDIKVMANKVKNGRKMIRKKEKADIRWNMEMIKHDTEETESVDEKVKVAILDSGIDYANDIEIAKSIDLVSDEEVNPLFIDITGHGSSVAGVIAAKENEEGITGINPNVELYSAKILDNENAAPISRVIEGIYWAIDQKVDIINISFGTKTKSVALEKAIQDAYESGILIIAAAGNTGSEIEYPAAYKEVMAVGAISSSGESSDFSANGDELEIVAPGEKIESTGGFGGTVVCSGTSMAAPHVVGVASLIWQKDKSVTNEFVRNLLNASANSYGDKEQYGNGLIDANRAMEIYDKFRAEYEESGSLENANNVVEENCENIAIFDTSSYVEGSWSYDKHNEAISNSDLSAADISIIKTGATYPDSEVSGVKGLGNYPEWHGGYESDNCIGSYIYVTCLARALQHNIGINTVYAPGGIGATQREHLLNAVANINWNQMIATPSTRNKTLFVWGMAIHTATDLYAHSSWANVYCKIEAKNKWEHLDHEKHNGKADDPTTKPKRYETAAKVARKSVKRYVQGGDGTVQEFLPEGGYENAGTNWTIKGLSDNARNLGCGPIVFNQLYQYTEAPRYHSYK